MLLDLDHVVTALSHMCDLSTPTSDSHSQNTILLALQIGERVGLGPTDLTLLRYAADLHDLGKLFIDKSILDKPGKLNKAQRAQIEKHPELGFEAMHLFRGPHQIERAILYHHEHWDGSGYPHKLQGDSIPEFARIVAIADAWDALQSDRPYRPAHKPAKALDIMNQCAGWFDPRLYAVFLDIVRGGVA